MSIGRNGLYWERIRSLLDDTQLSPHDKETAIYQAILDANGRFSDPQVVARRMSKEAMRLINSSDLLDNIDSPLDLAR